MPQVRPLCHHAPFPYFYEIFHTTSSSAARSSLDSKSQARPPPLLSRPGRNPPVPPTNDLMLPHPSRIPPQHRKTPRGQPDIHTPSRALRALSLAGADGTIVWSGELVEAEKIAVVHR